MNSGIIEGEHSINNARIPNNHAPIALLAELQFFSKHFLLFARYCHAAHPSNPKVITVNKGRYGSNAIKALAERKPSNRSTREPRQHAEAKNPAIIAPSNEGVTFFENESFISFFQ